MAWNARGSEGVPDNCFDRLWLSPLRFDTSIGQNHVQILHGLGVETLTSVGDHPVRLQSVLLGYERMRLASDIQTPSLPTSMELQSLWQTKRFALFVRLCQSILQPHIYIYIL